MLLFISSLNISVLHVAVAVCVGAAGVAVLVWRWKVQDRRRKARRHCNDPNYETFPLLQSEYGVRGSASVTTITFFTGDSDAAKDWIKMRTLEIMRANPWLAGRLVSSDEDSRLHLCHPKSITQQDLQDYVTVLDNPSLSHTMKYRDIVDKYGDSFIKRGMECFDLDEQLFKVLFIRISAKDFAVVISFSHMLGDGHTYYKIYSMFSCKQSVTALTALRRHEFADCSDRLVRIREAIKCKLFVLGALLFLVLPKPKSRRCFVAELNPEWIAAEKQKHCSQENSTPYVSTNDLLVSWFVRTADLDYCLMAFDARKRIPAMMDIDSTFAGNYITPIMYLKRDACSPEQVRKSLSFVSAEDSPRGEAGFRTESDQVPSSFEMLRFRSGLTSNWTTFYSEIEFPSTCTVNYHIPAVQRNKARFPSVLLIFRQSKDKVGLMVASPCRAVHEAALTGSGPFLAGSATEVVAN